MCDQLRAAVEDDTVALYYLSRLRTFTLHDAEPGQTPLEQAADCGSWGLATGWVIRYCPWTGSRLPRELGDEWESVAHKEYGFVHWKPFDPIDSLPSEMHTDEWWKRRIVDHPEWEIPRPSLPHENEMHDDEEWKPYVDDSLPGHRRWPERPPHVCWAVNTLYTGPRCMYAYLPYIREYGVRILELDKPVDFQPIRIVPVTHCPWCGIRHPPSLRHEWEERLRTLGLTTAGPDLPAGLPEDLASDTWWKYEGL